MRARVRRLPKLTTPERASFEAYRQRQQERSARRGSPGSSGDDSPPGKTPLGLDPVEGEPVDLQAMVRGDGEIQQPTPEEIRQANSNFQRVAGGNLPDGFGDGIDSLGEDQ